MRGKLPVGRARGLVLGVVLAGCNGLEHPSVRATARQGTVTVEIVDRDGNGLEGVQLELAGKQARTDAAGIAAFPKVVEGGYLLQVDATGWERETVGVRPTYAAPDVPHHVRAQLEPADPSDVRFLFAGDLSFDDGIDDPNRDGIADDSVVPATRGAAAGARALLAPLEPLLSRFDLVTANLATVLGSGRTPHPRKPNRALAPADVARGLAASRIDLVNLGNDHGYDYLDDGVRDTVNALLEAQVGSFGAGRDLGEASAPSLTSRLGITLGQVALSAVLGHGATPRDDTPPFFEAAAEKAGVVAATPVDVGSAVRQAALGADLVVAHLTAGAEWSADTSQLAPLADAAAKAGAALVVGHGPRPLMPLFRAGQVVVAAGLGQLVFGGQRPEGRAGVLLEAQVRFRRLRRLRLWPIALVHYGPQLATGQLAARILRRVAAISQPGVLVYLCHGRGEVAPSADGVRTLETAKEVRGVLTATTDGAAATPGTPLLEGDREGFVVSVTAAVASGPPRELAIELGRELLWDGGFEEETIAGAKLGTGSGWRFSGPDVGPSDEVARTGRLALELRRKSGNAGPASVRGAGLLTLLSGHRYTFAGCWRLSGSSRGSASLGVYPSRQLGAKSIARVAAAELTASNEWQCFNVEHVPAVDTLVSPEILLDRPAEEGARLVVDDLSLVEWDPPLPSAAAQVPAPNEYEFARVRSAEPGEVALHWVTRRYLPIDP